MDTKDLPQSQGKQALRNELATLTYVQRATADNTREAYRSDIRHFERWGGKLPTDPTTIVRYCEAHAESLNPRTLQRRIVALRQFHRYLGFPDPTQHPLVSKTLRGIKNTHGQPRTQAAPLLLPDIEALVSHLMGVDTLAAKRDIALITLGFFAALRGSELVGLQADYVQFESEGLWITLPRSKTDPTGEGQSCAVPKLNTSVCPFQALKTWQEVSGIQSGSLFPNINRWQQMGNKAMSISGLNLMLRGWAKQIHLPNADRISSHSLRRGMATSASSAGASIKSIMRQGRWRHEGTVLQYIEAGQKYDDNAVTAIAESTDNKKTK
ncbi:MAG: site-specific integrase [Ketobacter sp.]|nr:site-specific integrase [Planctomycetota bacterium]MCP5015656.1 site-specific integrase [Ketobacter sp.]